MDGLGIALLFVVTLGAFGAGVFAMIAGSRMTGRCLRGSCGGLAAHGPDGEPLSCATCPNRKRSTP